MRYPIRAPRGIPLRAVAPNAVTALALCSGLTGILFAIDQSWGLAAGSVILAGVLDGLDGRIARMLRGESRFGAELDSLSDVIAFGVSPAIILYLWSLQRLGENDQRFGWMFALAHVVSCALRLARFNANIDVSDQPHKSAGFLTGVPAPAAAGLAMLPLYIFLIFKGRGVVAETVSNPAIVAPWLAFIAFLMISSVATFSWSSLRLRRHIRLEALAGVAIMFGALLSAPWPTLTAICFLYLAMIPFGMRAYARVTLQRGRAKRDGR